MALSNFLPPDRQPTLRVIAMATDTNAGGDIFGGWIIAQIDLAGSIVGHQRAQGRVVTVAVQSVQFHQPVLVGDVVSFYASVTRVGRTSLTVDVAVYAERWRPMGVTTIGVTEATLTYVAIDEARRPRPVDRPQDNGSN